VRELHTALHSRGARDHHAIARGDCLAPLVFLDMPSRKSQPRVDKLQLRVMPTADKRADNTLVDGKPGPVLQFAVGTHHARSQNAPAPTAAPVPMATADTRGDGVIPFARPRAMSAMPATFAPVQPPAAAPAKRSRRATPTGVAVVTAPTWGSKQDKPPVAAPTWGSAANKLEQVTTTPFVKPDAPKQAQQFAAVQPPAPARSQLPATRAPLTLAPNPNHALGVAATAPQLHTVAQPARSPAPLTLGPQPHTQHALAVQPAPVFMPPQTHAQPAHAPLPLAPPPATSPVPKSASISTVFPVAAPFDIPSLKSSPNARSVTADFGAEGPTLQDAAVPSLAPARWAAFEKLGLVAKTIDPKQWSKHVVTAYRLLGFAILTIIVVVLIGYITTTAFFYWSDSWVVPTALSPTDEKIVSLQAQLAERQNQRDQTAVALDQAERAIVVQQAFQGEFAKAIKSDLDGRKAALERMHQLAAAAASTRLQIRRSNTAYASASQARMAQEWKAGLIDRTAMLSGKFQLAQITSSNLSLAERQAEYESRAADLEAQTRSLEALLDNSHGVEAMSYDVLKIKQEYEASRLDTQKAIETRDTLRIALAREDKLLGSLKQSSYLRAMNDNAQVAFVPYGNLKDISKGASLYGCKLGMVLCHKVGTVMEILPGEVQFKHPHRDKMLRGQMVELKLEDGAAATDDVLFVGGRPLFI
jgi:hypothetical protein